MCWPENTLFSPFPEVAAKTKAAGRAFLLKLLSSLVPASSTQHTSTEKESSFHEVFFTKVPGVLLKKMMHLLDFADGIFLNFFSFYILKCQSHVQSAERHLETLHPNGRECKLSLPGFSSLIK